MNEELTMPKTEDSIQVDDIEVVENEVDMSGLEYDVNTEETVEIIDVIPIEEVEIEIEEGIGWTGGDNTYHYSLAGRDEAGQHPIKAIAGLRDELNKIEKLQIIYSDQIGLANYYAWKDETRDEFGYFVSLIPHSSMIKICDGGDIFGVTVDVAGFIGGQEEIITESTDGSPPKHTFTRDNSYALVATTGLVDVRCESDVVEGDCVVSNAYGIAEKTTSGCGYKVISVNDKNGVLYASIALGVQACTTDVISKNIGRLETRVDTNEINIATAINVANEAFDKANGCVKSNEEISGEVNEALGVVGNISNDVEGLKMQIANAALISAQAKSIAESAATSAESMKNEAVKSANSALAETSNLRKELEAIVVDIDIDLENTALELEATKESIVSTKNELQGNIDEAVKDIESLEQDLEPLTTWPEGSSVEDTAGVAGFVARANEDSITLASIVTWKGDSGESLAGFVQEVTEENATVKSIASYKRKDADGNVIEPGGATGLMAQVDANQAELNAVASYEKNGVKGLAGLVAQVDENKSSLSVLADYEYKDEDGNVISSGLVGLTGQVTKDASTLDTLASYEHKDKNGNVISSGVAGLISQVNKDASTLSTLTSYEHKDADGNVVSNGVSGLIAQVDQNSSDLEILAKFEQGGNKGIAGIVTQVNADASELLNIASHTYTDANGNKMTGLSAINQQVTDQGSTIEGFTSWQDATDIAMTRIEQKADANGAYIHTLVTNIDKYSVGEYSYAYGFTLEQAQETLETGIIYVPTSSHTETYTNFTQTFTQKYYYTWDGAKWVESSSPVVNFSGSYVVGNNGAPYWYIPGSNNVVNGEVTYEANTLYLWQSNNWRAVASLKGSSSNRAVSQIRQNANSIEASVTNLKGDVASSKQWIDNNSTNIQDVVTWKNNNEESIATTIQSASDSEAYIAQIASVKNDDGTINAAASIVTAVNEDISGVTISADHINLQGYVTVTDLSNKGSETFINGGNIITDTIEADAINVIDLKAFEATIGSFTIDDNSIRHTKTSYNDTVNDGVYLGIDGIGLGKGKFWVTDEGFLHAESGEFSGNITGGSININDNFIVDSSGNVSLNGNITWGTGSSPTQVVYSTRVYNKPSDNTSWSSFPSTSDIGWHTTYSTSDYYASYTYDGGASWTDAVQIQGIDGNTPTIQDDYWYVDGVNTGIKAQGIDGNTPYIEDGFWCLDGVNLGVKAKGEDGKDGSDAEVTSGNVFNALTNDGTIFGCFTDQDNKLYINAEYIKANYLSAITANLGTINAGVMQSSNYTVDETTGTVTKGMMISLDLGAITTPNFQIRPSGVVTVNGNIITSDLTATGGTIGGFDITDGGGISKTTGYHTVSLTPNEVKSGFSSPVYTRETYIGNGLLKVVFAGSNQTLSETPILQFVFNNKTYTLYIDGDGYVKSTT